MESRSRADLRRAIAQIRRQRKRQARRYPADLRRGVIAHVVSEQARGISVRLTAESLGLSYPTVLGWLPNAAKRFRAVAVKSSEPPGQTSALSLVTAQGHRVEGLSREDVAFLLQSLA